MTLTRRVVRVRTLHLFLAPRHLGYTYARVLQVLPTYFTITLHSRPPEYPEIGWSWFGVLKRPRLGLILSGASARSLRSRVDEGVAYTETVHRLL